MWCHQNSYDETLNVEDNINKKKMTILYIRSKLYFAATPDLTGMNIYICKRF